MVTLGRITSVSLRLPGRGPALINFGGLIPAFPSQAIKTDPHGESVCEGVFLVLSITRIASTSQGALIMDPQGGQGNGMWPPFWEPGL